MTKFKVTYIAINMLLACSLYARDKAQRGVQYQKWKDDGRPELSRVH